MVGGSRNLIACCATVVLAVAVTACGAAPSHPSASASSSAAAGPSHELRVEDQNLKQALLSQMTRTAALEAHVAAAAGAEALSAKTRAESRLSRRPRLRQFIDDYFRTVLAARAPGQPGAGARAGLARFFAPGSAALARVRFIALGKLAVAGHAPWPDGMLTSSLAVVHDLQVAADGRHVTVVVYPVRQFWTYVSARGQVRTGEFTGAGAVTDPPADDPWDAAPSDSPHRLTLARRGASWIVADDFMTGDSAIARAGTPALMKAGGAPEAVWQAETRRIAARTKNAIPVPGGVRSTFERFLTLLNEHRYEKTDALFVGGRGYRASWFSRPHGDWRYTLTRIGGFDPLSSIALASAPDVPFVAAVNGPAYDKGGYDFAGGGMLGYSLWNAHREADGRWLIQGAGNGIPPGLGGSPGW